MAKNEVAEKKTTAVAPASDFEQFDGLGFEETTSEDMAIPFLRILADLSPQVQKRKAEYVEGAEPGMIFNTVLNEVYEGEEGIQVVPCHYFRRYVEWRPREQGGGYVQAFMPDDPILSETVRNDRNQDVLPNGNHLVNTAHFFCLFLHPEKGPLHALVTMSSTQLKKAKKWLSMAQTLTGKTKDGRIFTLPLMSQVYRMATVPEENDRGSWYGWEITRERQLDLSDEADRAVFEAAVAFAKSVKSGEVEIKEDSTATAPDAGDIIDSTVGDDDIPF